MRQRISLSVLVAMSVSCAGPMEVGLRPILTEAADNEVALMAKYVGEEIRVSGRVSVVSIHKQRAVEHRWSSNALGKSQAVQKHMPYVYLVPEDGKSGRALCFFPEGHYSTAAQVKKGERLTLDCWFQEYVRKPKDQVVVMNRCRIVR